MSLETSLLSTNVIQSLETSLPSAIVTQSLVTSLPSTNVTQPSVTSSPSTIVTQSSETSLPSSIVPQSLISTSISPNHLIKTKLPSVKGPFHISYLNRRTSKVSQQTFIIKNVSGTSTNVSSEESLLASGVATPINHSNQSATVVPSVSLSTAPSSYINIPLLINPNKNDPTQTTNLAGQTGKSDLQVSTQKNTPATKSVSSSIENQTTTVDPETNAQKAVSSTSLTSKHNQSDVDNNLDSNKPINELFITILQPRNKLAVQTNFIAWVNKELAPFYPSSMDLLELYKLPNEIQSWNTKHTQIFLDTLGFKRVAKIMYKNNIDGQAFLFIKPKDLTNRFMMKPSNAAKLGAILKRIHGSLRNEYFQRIKNRNNTCKNITN